MNVIYEKMSEHIMPTYGRKMVCFEKGKGMWLWDDEGNPYMDLVSGVAVNALGHCSQVVNDALIEQASLLGHLSNLYWNKPQLSLAETLIDLSHGAMKHVFFCNSGTEALEGAVKICRKYGKENEKPYLLYMNNSFHGRSTGALAITGQVKYQAPFGELIPNCIAIDFNDLEGFEKVTETHKNQIAGIFIEPIQGEGGVLKASNEFLQAIKSYCDTYQALLVFDEVQCGAGRLGTYFAFEHFGISPDVVCMAKGLGGGVPIGAILANEKASVLKKGDHGSTYGGNPLMCGVSQAVTKTISDKAFLEAVQKASQFLKASLASFKERGLIEDHRGEGLLLALVVKEPAQFVEVAFRHKVLMVSAGSDAVRILPPLNLEQEALKEISERLETILIAFHKEIGGKA